MARLANSAPPSSMTCEPSGTITISLPQKASISSVISRPGSTASVRLTISAPKRAVSRVCRPATQRPERITLLKRAATWLRLEAEAAVGGVVRREVTGERDELAEGLRDVDAVEPFGVLGGGQPAGGKRAAEHGRGAVPVRVRGPQLKVVGHGSIVTASRAKRDTSRHCVSESQAEP